MPHDPRAACAATAPTPTVESEPATMASGVQRFSVGAFQCVVVSDCEWATDGPDEWRFVNVAPAAVAAVFATHDWPNRAGMNCLVIDTGAQRLLVDTGDGPDNPDGGQLLTNLARAGVAPQSIDLVVLTHGHYDHIGWNTDGAGQPTFPNATYVMQRDEWRHWTEQPSPFGAWDDAKGRDYSDRHLLPLRERFRFIDLDDVIVPGVTALSAVGHTPGQIALLVESNGERLLCTADTFHHPVELVEPDWYFDFDHDPAVTVVTRRRICDLAATQQLPTFVYHCPFPGLGRIERAGEHWEWRVAE
jgi:glyoxylase-like metal-dependent hydrolase (beta-lactamase superfamily II)